MVKQKIISNKFELLGLFYSYLLSMAIAENEFTQALENHIASCNHSEVLELLFEAFEVSTSRQDMHKHIEAIKSIHCPAQLAQPRFDALIGIAYRRYK